jgi:hypothetical protein
MTGPWSFALMCMDAPADNMRCATSPGSNRMEISPEYIFRKDSLTYLIARIQARMAASFFRRESSCPEKELISGLKQW